MNARYRASVPYATRAPSSAVSTLSRCRGSSRLALSTRDERSRNARSFLAFSMITPDHRHAKRGARVCSDALLADGAMMTTRECG
jgi:hypothetical protein